MEWEAERPAGTSGAPMTDMDDGQQYIAMTVGDRDYGAERVTFALRDENGIMRHISLTAALVLCVWVAMAGQVAAQASAVQPVTRMYSDAQGETHLETVMMDVGRSNGFSATDTVYFSRFAADMNVDWHPGPRRQFLITLSGSGYEVETSDGAVAQLLPGSVLLVEDTNPAHRGHQTRSLGGETLVMFVPID